MPFLERNDISFNYLEFFCPSFKVFLKRRLTDNTSFLLEFLILLLKLLSLLFKFTQLILHISKLVSLVIKAKFLFLVLFHDELILFTVMRKDNDSSCDFVSQFVQVFVTFFDLFVQGLVFNLKLLIINQMETISELFSSAEDLLLISKPVSESDVLETILMNFLILGLVMLFPIFDHLGT